jgi:hypothetical protein
LFWNRYSPVARGCISAACQDLKRDEVLENEPFETAPPSSNCHHRKPLFLHVLLYLESCRPQGKATLVIDNSNIEASILLKEAT